MRNLNLLDVFELKYLVLPNKMTHCYKTYSSFQHFNTRFVHHQMVPVAYAKAFNFYHAFLKTCLEMYAYDVNIAE